MAITLGYWDLRGLADPIRLILALVGKEYDLKLYTFGPGPEYHKGNWRDQEDTIGVDFPNLPYYIEGDVRISQALAILRHLARKHELTGKTEEELIRVDAFEQITWEVLSTSFGLWKVGDESAKKQLTEYLPGKLKQIQKALGSDKFVLGDRITYVDFILYSTLDYIRILHPRFPGGQVLDNFQGLKDFLDRIEALPEVAKFINSDKFSRTPITGPMYAYGGQKEV